MSQDPKLVREVMPQRPTESWQDFFELLKTIDVPDDFLADRQDAPPQPRKLFDCD